MTCFDRAKKYMCQWQTVGLSSDENGRMGEGVRKKIGHGNIHSFNSQSTLGYPIEIDKEES